MPGTALCPWQVRYGVIPEPSIEGVVMLQKAGSPGTFLSHLLRAGGGRVKGREGFQSLCHVRSSSPGPEGPDLECSPCP